jgi:uncharacterized Zn finger protein (UPF0148 family)
MHSVTCPSCGKCVEVDFRPTAGFVWCPNCQKPFSPPAQSGRETSSAENIEEHPSDVEKKSEDLDQYT